MIRVPKEKVMHEEAFDFICDAEDDLRYAIEETYINQIVGTCEDVYLKRFAQN